MRFLVIILIRKHWFSGSSSHASAAQNTRIPPKPCRIHLPCDAYRGNSRSLKQEVAVSYNQTMIFESISMHLHRNPCTSLGELSGKLRVSRRTLQKVIIVKTGKGFSNLREEMLLAKVRNLFMSQPAWAIKEVSFAVGYRSARSFARAIKRACGSSPEELRSHAAWGYSDTADSLECQVTTIHPMQ